MDLQDTRLMSAGTEPVCDVCHEKEAIFNHNGLGLCAKCYREVTQDEG